jgi:alanyl-tRNA synthetase
MEKLYEENPYLTHFTACVESCVSGKKGYEVILNQTAFYPEGGGQPYDLGTLGGTAVLEVHEREGRVVHLCQGPLEPGTQVEGSIDWERRFDLMQNHSGEHIVSGLAHAKWGCDNVGFHMGADVITIDLNVTLDENDLAWLEAQTNRYLWEDHPVVVTYPSPEELETLEYRSKKALTGRVRIASFPGADTCACCGTHVASSGQVGLVKLLSVQKFREGVRIELVCGNRAVRYLAGVLEQNRQISNLLSAKLFETSGAVERLLEEKAALSSRVMAMEERHFAALAGQYSAAGDVLLFEDGLSPDSLRRLCDSVLHACGGRCACFSGQDGQGYKYAVGQREGDLRTFTKELNAALHGRGGGKPDFVQGSVQATRADIEKFFSPKASSPM